MLIRCPSPILTVVLLLPVLATSQERVTVAVASNFVRTATEIADRFNAETGHQVQFSAASTGKLYAQIINGAPYDILLAADVERPRLLEEAELGVKGTRFAYALGTLVLWSRDPGVAAAGCRAQLVHLDKKHLAIANPATAPYGVAAREFLLDAGLWEQVRPRLVMGENILQTLHFVASGNASLGLIARSQTSNPMLPSPTCEWLVPTHTYSPLEQQAILLRRAADKKAASAFLNYLRGPAGREQIAGHGYLLPD